MHPPHPLLHWALATCTWQMGIEKKHADCPRHFLICSGLHWLPLFNGSLSHTWVWKKKSIFKDAQTLLKIIFELRWLDTNELGMGSTAEFTPSGRFHQRWGGYGGKIEQMVEAAAKAQVVTFGRIKSFDIFKNINKNSGENKIVGYSFVFILLNDSCEPHIQ